MAKTVTMDFQVQVFRGCSMKFLSQTLTNFLRQLNLGSLDEESKLRHFAFAQNPDDKKVNQKEGLKFVEVKKFYRQLISKQTGLANNQVVVENYFDTPEGVLVFFHVPGKKTKIERYAETKIYTLLFETAAPTHSLWPKPKLIFELPSPQRFLGGLEIEKFPELEFVSDLQEIEIKRLMFLAKTRSQTKNWQFISLLKLHHQYWAFWWLPGQGVFAKIYPSYLISGEIALRHALPLLKKAKQNPILKPNGKNSWEAFNTFNPAAFYAAGKVHILYRAQGYDYVSTIGYAQSDDGIKISKTFNQPIYKPSQSFEGINLPLGNPAGEYASGGGCGGCEDPRTTIIDDRIYMTYVAYDGSNPPRVALTSIALSDFLAERFLWEKPILISPPGVVDKSACIFPEKINGKYVILHRVFPDILIDFVDSLEFVGNQFLHGQDKISPRSKEWWDSRKVGAGAPPVKTKLGWLLIYQAVDDKDASQYKVGAMLLDLKNPSRVLARSSKPIMEPKEHYESAGFKAGVIYPCGALVIKERLFVYYGGADSYVCVATAKLDQFLNDLQKTGAPHLEASQLGIE